MIQYNLFDKVLIRLNNATEPYLSYFNNEIGYFFTNAVATMPLIDVYFVNEIKHSGPLKYINKNMVYDSTYLYYIDKNGNKLGFNIEPSRVEIVCQYGIDPLHCFYTVENMLLNLMTQRGAIFMHSSGVVHNGVSIMFPAWGGTGKTNLLIQFLLDGADFISDDLVLIDEQGMFYPYPKPINLLYYNFDEYKNILLDKAASKIKRVYRYLCVTRKVNAIIKKLLHNDSFPVRFGDFISMRFAGQCNEHIHTNRLFPNSNISNPKSMKFVFFFTRTTGKSFKIEPIEADILANKMSFCLRWERNYYDDQFLSYLFAYPEKEVLVNKILHDEREISKKFFDCAEHTFSATVGLDLSPKEICSKIKDFITENSK